MFVVIGASGNTGSVVAETLLAKGKPVRVLTRSAEKVKKLAERGVEVALGDLSDSASLVRALEGAEGVYLLSPPDMHAKDFISERKALFEPVATALKSARVGHVVFLSSTGAQHEKGTGIITSLYWAEQALKKTGLPVTFVRAGYFVENWAAVLPVAKKDGVLPTFLVGDKPIAMLAAHDIGVAAAQALLDGPRGTRIIELAGPVDVSPNDVAAALSTLLGRKIPVAETPLDAVVPTFTSFGASQNIATLYREMFAGLRDGTVARETKGTELIRTTTPLADALKPLLV
ncbi:MAG TPA: NmrA family NAD(P)-binding protein [Polyangiaceae bacterium]|jgi:uncharacterized protein YbjT (DUF2867 family)